MMRFRNRGSEISNPKSEIRIDQDPTLPAIVSKAPSRRTVLVSAHMRQTRVRSFLLVALTLFSAASTVVIATPPSPAQLSNEQFWQLSSTLSESDGYFRSDNLLSNEINFQYVIP